MEVSKGYAKVMFGKGLTINVYDDCVLDTSFYGGDRNKPVPLGWNNKDFNSWEELEEHYVLISLNMVKFDICVSSCSLGKQKGN